MKNIFIIILFATISCQLISAKSMDDTDRIKSLELKYSTLQSKQVNVEINLRKLTELQKDSEHRLDALSNENARLTKVIDSLQNACRQLANTQAADRKNISGEINKTNSNVQTNQDMLRSRTLWIGIMAVALLTFIIGVAYQLTKRIKSGNTSIGEVRKAQEALQLAQTKMQEESVKLDDKLLELFEKQISATPMEVGTDKPDHSLALKVADEIVRIELNMSRMDSSIKGYKQLAKAVERIKDNFKANGYEIIDMLGKPYNEGMKVTANFVADEELEEGRQIITGITKPQINYNGQMIQAAQITVSQNI
ncbi:hypothetical protein IX321_001880 [Bacteroides pyogenes]|uniref:hypothetical protein n=2 Tax=Bacteroides pyogenes TaxID=310300 RepID=UPI001DF0AF0B|nr:hypothetical protein [Bacteroides pyogenes]MBR8709072.1 hypothetical protein [Bacteroides pyogenes]MBR8717871.1 hypothetical protein [Bacteroides pyogenes]MBR8747374.1 hypothetical protein [Bacteroides pyogenes]MBR8757717.1 hypothetical protein [Bacteroides pyogenes]MBR8780943.1 hypothetical protein [Bacteroides pyogenes]